MHEIKRLVILEVLSNPLLWKWGHNGDLTADFAPVASGEFDTTICQIPCIPLLSLGDRGGA